MSKIDGLIARTRKLDAAATPGPWEHPEWCHKCELSHIEGPEDVGGTVIGIRVRIPGDLTLIAEYRTLAPKLADMLAKLLDPDMLPALSEWLDEQLNTRQTPCDSECGCWNCALAKALRDIEAMVEGGTL